jgi:uncharacterized protein (UPF0254 family)
MEQAVVAFVLGLAQKYPLALSVFSVVGVLRAVFKPIVSGLRAVADATPSPKDNALLDKVEGGKVFKAVAWFIDYISSIKLPGYDVK